MILHQLPTTFIVQLFTLNKAIYTLASLEYKAKYKRRRNWSDAQRPTVTTSPEFGTIEALAFWRQRRFTIRSVLGTSRTRKVVLLDEDNTKLFNFSKLASADQDFYLPEMVLLNEKQLLVCHSTLSQVHFLERSGKKKWSLKRSFSASLNHPWGVCIDFADQSELFIADT